MLKICKHCLLPETYESLQIADDGMSCNLCTESEHKNTIDWDKKKALLGDIIEKFRGKSEYDCIIPFSGGKDSTFTLYYLMKEYKIKPLVVRFDSGFMRPIHANNIKRTIKKLGVDYISFTPNQDVVRLLMKESFWQTTDFCWHCHTGVYSYPLKMAVKFNTPLIFWGESLSEMNGGYEFDSTSIEFEDKKRFDAIRTLGINANAMIARLKNKNLVIDNRNLDPFMYPTDQELEKLNYYSICLGSFIPWDYLENTKIIQEKIGWEVDTVEGVPLEINREGAKIECWLQATRDYIKYLKRGYGRVTQCVNFEIRQGRLTAEEGLRLIQQHEGKKPFSLPKVLEYLDLSDEEFHDFIAKHVVPPNTMNYNLPLATKPHDFEMYF